MCADYIKHKPNDFEKMTFKEEIEENFDSNNSPSPTKTKMFSSIHQFRSDSNGENTT
jgi:hypothetical protein